VVPRPVLGAARADPVRARRDLLSIPNENIIWSVAGLVIFGGYTILDFNRLRRSRQEAVPIAASIFLDVLNVFLFSPSCSAGTTTDEGDSRVRYR
jgi:hypothetical protein